MASQGESTGTPAAHVNGAPCIDPATLVAKEVRSDIERTLLSRHPNGGERLLAIEDKAKGAGTSLWEHLKKRPYTGVAAASILGFAVASATGVGELAIAVLCGYAAYEVLRRGRPVSETVEEVVRDVTKMA